MRVVAVTNLYPPSSLVGSWLTTHAFLADLAARGHDVQVVRRLAPSGRPYELDGVLVHSGAGQIARLAATADLVVTHVPGPDLAVDVPVVRFAHGVQATPAGCAGSALVVFTSTALREQVGWDGPSIVLHPPIDPAVYATTPGDRVTLVNLSAPKGGRLFWRLARTLPDRRFLGVLGGYGAQERGRHNNVEVRRSTVDVRTVYAATRVLLMPSAVETWGRVGVEAMCSGIPVIAHPSPGLVEALGPAAIWVDRADIHGWVAALDRLDDPNEWARWSAAALDRAARLDPRSTFDRFAAEVDRLTRRETSPCAP